MDIVFQQLKAFFPPVVILLLEAVLLFLKALLFHNSRKNASFQRILKYSIAAVIILFSTLALVLSMTPKNRIKGQIIAFLVSSSVPALP